VRNIVRASILLLTLLQCVTPVYSKSCSTTVNNFPIINFILNPSCELVANYQFSPQSSSLFCISDVLQNSGVINWTYRGNPSSSSLPVILNKAGGEQKFLIDSSGQIVIHNNQAKRLIIVCQFG